MGPTSVLSNVGEGAVPEVEPRPVYLRAYVPVGEPPRSRRGAFPKPSDWVLVFDTETWPDAAQNLRIGTYQLRQRGSLRSKGVFYNPDEVTEAELSALQAEAPRHGCRLMTATQFREEVLFDAAYAVDATIVGFNLPFDISRLAIGHDSARAVRRKNGTLDRSMAGGFTFKLSQDPRRPRIRVRHLSRRSAFISFAQPPENQARAPDADGAETTVARPGFFLDLKTLGGALTSKSLSLNALAKLLGRPQKRRFEQFDRAIDAELIAYAVQDAEVTWQCYEALTERYQRQGLSTPPTRIYSEASLGKAYLEAMGIKPWRACQPDFPPEIIGALMSSYFGGRAEVHRRREIVPALYCDFASMYPTVCTLMDLWTYVVAGGVEHDDWTDGAQSFLASVTLDDLQDPATWRALPVLVQIKPDADILPVRTQYGAEPATTIGLNYLSSDRPVWATLPDCIASKLLTGKAPQIVRATRFVPRGGQDGLRPINIAGHPDYRVDPARENFYKRVIDLRRDVKGALKAAKQRGYSQEADRLDAEQLALKILANATSYGIFIELNVEDADKDAGPVTGYGSDGPFATQPRQRERPGSFFHPLLATMITGAARLMLAITERRLLDEGLDWIFCDTDSMAFTPGAHTPTGEFRSRVERVCSWFEPLNPYAEGGPLLEFEDQNNDPKTGEPLDLYCYAISAKRYALFNWGPDGRPVIRKASAHGLGYLSPPYREEVREGEDEEPEDSERSSGVHLWQEHLWQEFILAARAENRGEEYELAWRAEFEQPATSRYAANTPVALGWFRPYNQTKPYAEQIRPFGFLLWYHAKKPAELAAEDPLLGFDPRQRWPRPVSTFAKDLAGVTDIWDRETGDRVDREWLRTYVDVLASYPVHSESKFLDGYRTQIGPTRRRHVRLDLVWNIGKEADRLEENSAIGAEDDPSVPYALSAEDRAESFCVIAEGKNRFGVRRLRKAAAMSDNTIKAVIDDPDGADAIKVVRLREAVRRLEARDLARTDAEAEQLATLKARAAEIGIGSLAAELGVDASNLSKMLRGKRSPKIPPRDRA
jgi:hypothetical protein